MEKELKKRTLCSTPIIFLLSLPLLCVGLDFFWCNAVPFHQWMQYFSGSETRSFNGGNPINRTLEELKFIHSHLSRLVRGEDRRNLDATGFACDKTYHSFHCVSKKPVIIDTTNMTVHIRSDHHTSQETVIRPYARQEGELNAISPVHIIHHTSPPPRCHYNHSVPAVVFSSGSTGNVFHEMNEIIIPLFITTKHFQTRVLLIMEDYKPSFMSKYGSVLSRLSAYDVMNPAENSSTHCFPGSVIGLKYHDNLALNSSDIPGGYGMPEFQAFLRLSFGLKFTHVSQIGKPRLVLLSRTNTRRFLNEDEMIETMSAIGFQVVVIKRSKVVSNLSRFSRLINSCSVLVGAHGAGLTNEIFLPHGAVMIQVELIGTEWASNTYYGDTAAAMGVRYLKYKIEEEESSLVKLYGRNHPFITDPVRLFLSSGYRAARSVYLDTQNVKVNISRFRETLVEAYSIVTDWAGR
ncbi:hypothetical protein ACS0TY_033490 [Phlomoides rotata]